MFWLLLWISWIVWDVGRVHQNWNNLVIVKTDYPELIIQNQSTVKNITYSASELKVLGNNMTKSGHGKSIPFNAIGNIRRLGLNKTRKRRKKINSASIRAVVPSNITQIETIDGNSHIVDNKLKISMINARSIKNKDALLYNHMLENGCDILVITETWLNESDTNWINACSFNTSAFGMYNTMRTEKRGGGISIVYNKRLDMQLKTKSSEKGFEYMVTTVNNLKKPLAITSVYHPPFGSCDNNRPTVFNDMITELLVDVLSSYKNNVVLGDFNLHLNDIVSNEIVTFRDTMEAMGLQQHVQQSTYIMGNLLDLVYTEIQSDLRVTSCKTGEFLTDHCIVHTTISFPKPHLTRKQITIRKTSCINRDEWIAEYNPANIHIGANVDSSAISLENELRRVYDKLAPAKKVNICARKPEPWYNSFIRQQKIVVRNAEKTWRKYRQPHQYKAFTNERNRYNHLINYHKTQEITSKVTACRGDSKKLHCLLHEITNSKPENPMPPSDSDDDLANRFADFFINKIDKIRKAMENEPIYDPEVKDIPKLTKLAPFTPDQVQSIIMGMQSKTCETDSIPTEILKDLLPACISEITALVNISMEQGEFCSHWKTAIVRPLLKKTWIRVNTQKLQAGQ